jgi:hypothetical protein
MSHFLPTEVPTEDEISSVEATLDFILPNSYKSFIRSGGLGDLRISHEILPPKGILDSLRYIADKTLVPFADNGCGDSYCWIRSGELEPQVVLWDHQTQDHSYDACSFDTWLVSNRRSG